MQSPTITEILETIRAYAPDADLQVVMDAYLLAARAHSGQTRKSGEAYLTHPMAVAMILANMRMDVDTVATALLHDALEDHPTTKAEMTAQVGPVITELVDGVTKIGKLKFRSQEELAAENFRKMMLAMSRDIRVILVKLADRLHNMSTLEGHDKPEKRARIAQETLDIFVPIANRLGITRMKTQLEDLCFYNLYPDAYAEIEAYLGQTQTDRDTYTERVVSALRDHLEQSGITCKVSGRAKHRFSIYRKMQEQGLKVSEVPDLLAFRVLLPDLGSCYAALGLVHASFPPIPDRIKDYIARPKPNGYQSLHTTVVGPEGRRVEVQFRTDEMHRVAEDGIAAHWKYKEGHLALSPEDVVKISRIRDAFETVREVEDATEFMETVKVEFYADEVFVFTPAGDVKSFPLGATTLDFAYAVHTDVGNHCTGARVNGRMVQLRYALVSGDTVEILTQPNQRPNRDWLSIARTGRAISKIRHFLRQEERDQGIRLGRDMIEAELKRFHWSFDKLRKEGRIKEVLKKRGYKELEPLLIDIARGREALATVVREFLPEGIYQTRLEESQRGGISGILSRFSRARSQSPVLISGEDGVLVTFSRCCNPLPGEPVMGFITRGRGISVHREDCQRLAELEADRLVPVEWDRGNDSRHTGTLQIQFEDRPGMLAHITKVCEQSHVNLSSVQAHAQSDALATCVLELSVRDVDELTRLIRNLEKIRGVESVHRAVG